MGEFDDDYARAASHSGGIGDDWSSRVLLR